MTKFSFSYSRWSLWSKCPQAFKYQNIDKIDTGPTAKPLLHGRKVHDDAAKYVTGKMDELPDALRLFTKLAADIRALPDSKKHVEEQMGFDKSCRRTGWFGVNTYYRFVWDVGIHASPTHIDAVDWKTGRKYDSYDDQKQMFALPAFWLNPDLETFTGSWVYLDNGDVDQQTFNRAQVFGPTCDPAANDGLHGLWQANAAMMEADRAFRPKPSKDACRFCDFGKRNLGICKEDAS